MSEERVINYVPKACPVCGATELQAEVVVTAQQNPDGTWAVMLPLPEDIDWEMTKVNNEVRCTNDQCGDPYGPDGKIVRLGENEDYFHYWMKNVKGLTEVAMVDKLEDLTEEDQKEFLEWSDNLNYSPWRGVIGECIEIK